MQNLQIIIAKVIGLKFLITNKDVRKKEKKIIIDIDNDNNASGKLVYNSTIYDFLRILKNVINYFYLFFILIMLSTNTFSLAYISILKRDYKYIIAGFMYCNFIFQFIVGFVYSNTAKKLYHSSSVIILWILFILITSSIIISRFAFIAKGVKVFIYTELFNSSLNSTGNLQAIPLFAFSSVGLFFGYSIFFFNSIIFSVTFISHSMTLEKYIKKTKKVLSNYDNNLMIIDAIANEFLLIKENYTNDVKKLNDIFSGTTISMLILGFNIASNSSTFLSSNYLSIIHIMDIVLIISVELVHMIVIGILKKNINDLMTLVFSKQFINCVLTKNNTENIYTDEKKYTETIDVILSKTKQIKDITTKALINLSETSKKTDWIALTLILGKEWDSFTIFGFKVDDSTRLKQLIGIGSSIVMIMTLINK